MSWPCLSRWVVGFLEPVNGPLTPLLMPWNITQCYLAQECSVGLATEEETRVSLINVS